jgi:3-oxoacyl-[acyl-carrier protein] reductase
MTSIGSRFVVAYRCVPFNKWRQPLSKPTYPDLKGKIAFVTGGSGGIGAETCRWLADNGVKAAVSGRNEEALDQVVAELRSSGAEAAAIPAECTNAESLERPRSYAEKRLGPIDILVAFAGSCAAMPAPVEATSESDWRSSIDHNLTASFLTLKTFLPDMKVRRSGSSLTMASTAGRSTSPASPAYAAAKAGMIMLTRHVAREVGGFNIPTNCLSPSAILTERTTLHMPEEKRSQIAALHPIPRLGTPADVATAALFLASESASWITGATIDVAGGRLMH